MRDPRYLAIISDKQAELLALAGLESEVRDVVVPLIDIRNPRPPIKGTRLRWTPESDLKKHI